MRTLCVTVAAAAALSIAPAAGWAAEPFAASQPAPKALGKELAYYEFMLGRHLESEGDIDSAIAAYERARRLDPRAAEIPAELSALYARQNRATDAIAAGDAALQIDPENEEAHRVLGNVHAALAERELPVGSERGAGRQRQASDASNDHARRAIEHLERGSRTPPVDPMLQMTLGRLYVRVGESERAIAMLSRLVEQEPQWVEGVGLLVEAYTGAGRTGDAVALLEKAAPLVPQYYAALAELHERERRWEPAASAYEKAVQQNPKSLDLMLRWMAALLNQPGREPAARARDLLADAVRENPTHQRALFLLVQAQRKLQDLEAAEATARRLASLDPASAWGAYALAQVFSDRREHRRVIDTLDPVLARWTAQATAADRQDVALLFTQRGFAEQQLRDFDAAIASFEQARRYSSRDVSLDLYAVQAHLAAGRAAEAVDRVRQARARYPQDLRLARLEAEALKQSGSLDQGLAVMEAAVRAHDRDPQAYVALAELYAGGRRLPEALRVLEEAGARFPTDLSIPFHLGAVLERNKRYGDAERAFRRVLARDPEHAPTLNYLGYMLADRGERLEESVQYIQRALALDPQNGSYLDSLGWAYFKLNKLAEAEAHLRQASDLLQSNSVVQDHFGDLLFKKAQYEQAIAAWERALAGDGESIDKAVIERKIGQARRKLERK